MAKVINFGCRLNQFEGKIIQDITNTPVTDNMFVINTCAVTEQAEKDGKKMIRKICKNNPDASVIVTGCSAQINPQQYHDMNGVTKILGNYDKLVASNYLSATKSIVTDIMSLKDIAPHMINGFDGKTRAFIEIQNGCNHRCTFCRIPYGRGNNRSVPVGHIVRQIKILIDNNYKEIVLTGVDITDYGTDLPGTPSLAELIRRILKNVPSLKRLRLSSVDVAEINQELLELTMYESRLMPHLHISLQSGDNMILKRMRRRHNRDQVIEFCNKIRRARPLISYGADLIVGFPTETEAMFANSLDLLRQSNIAFVHVFPYSAHKNTPAARMPRVPEDVIKKRAAAARKVATDIKKKLYDSMIGAKHKVLTENFSNHFTKAHTDNFSSVRINRKLPPGIELQITPTNNKGDFLEAVCTSYDNIDENGI